jgi:hypothetical protein
MRYSRILERLPKSAKQGGKKTKKCGNLNPVGLYRLVGTTSVVKRLACWPLVPKIASSNPVEAVGFFFGSKNPQHAFLRRRSKAVCPVSFAARKRTLLDYVEIGSLRPNYSDFSRSKFPPSLTGGSSDRVGSGLSVEVPLHSSSMGALWS